MQVSNFLLVLLPSGPPLANADVASNATLAATQQAAPKLLYDFNCQAEELAMLATTIVTSRIEVIAIVTSRPARLGYGALYYISVFRTVHVGRVGIFIWHSKIKIGLNECDALPAGKMTELRRQYYGVF